MEKLLIELELAKSEWKIFGARCLASLSSAALLHVTAHNWVATGVAITAASLWTIFSFNNTPTRPIQEIQKDIREYKTDDSWRELLS